jgi:Protein of unknown function (DUF4239)
VPAAIAVGVHAIFRRITPPGVLIEHQDVAGFLVAVVGVLYAVVLGFVVVTAWARFDSAKQNADIEASALGDAFGFSAMLPEPLRSQESRTLAAYAMEVRDREWHLLAKGQVDLNARKLLIAARETLGNATATRGAKLGDALREQSIRDSVQQSIKEVFDARRLRIIESQEEIHPAMFAALIIGALMVLAFVLLFGVENAVLQFTMTGIIAGMIGLLLGLVVALSKPYGGIVRIEPAAWTYVIEKNHFAELVPSAHR